MQIELATCPACGTAFHPLRARAVSVIDGRVRAFCSAACRDRGLRPAEPARAEGDVQAPSPSLARAAPMPTEQKVLAAAAVVTLLVFAALIGAGRHRTALARPGAPAALARATPAAARAGGAGPNESSADVWIQPLAGQTRHLTAHDRRLFAAAREGVAARECRGGRCALEIEAAPGDVVMAVHDGVIETVERDPDVDGRRGQEGRFIRINHKGGTVVSSYLELDGIREDLNPGIPVRAGEPIGTVGRAGASRPHLRFAVSLREAADGVELFVDPQPMLALWPTRKRASGSLHAMERAPRPSASD